MSAIYRCCIDKEYLHNGLNGLSSVLPERNPSMKVLIQPNPQRVIELALRDQD
jgi:hypothetical protein